MKNSYLDKSFIVIILLSVYFTQICSYRFHKEKFLIEKQLQKLSEFEEVGLENSLEKYKKELIQNIKEGKLNFSNSIKNFINKNSLYT
jgi:hypothetical protein